MDLQDILKFWEVNVMAIKYVYDKHEQFNSNHYDQLRETLDTEIKSLVN
jgi:hypothetical protein